MSEKASPAGKAPDLFTPVRIGDLELPNRVVMAPLTRNRAGPGGVPQPMNAEYYAQRASAGLIISEASQVSQRGIGYPGTPGIHDEAQVEGWRGVTRAVHEHGGRIFLQLWHVGRISHPSLQPDGAAPVAPSAVPPEGEAVTYEGPRAFVTPRALETSEIPAIVEQFRQGAANAREAGFDGVEIHGANGYLIDQFLRDGTNHRTDVYGGSVENRARFLMEVAEAVIGVWGAERVGVRLSPASAFNDMSDSDPQTHYGRIVERLDGLGLAYLHIVELVEIVERFDFGALRRAFSGPYMANAGYDGESAARALRGGAADLVAFGQLFLANPDLPRRLAEGAPLNEPDPDSFYGGDERGYLDYPPLD
ncbi:MAG: alkene reductase [Chromatiales bacterium]|jgi:N-ethylmaleimide reductase